MITQEGRPNTTITDELGKFALPVIVHDTDILSEHENGEFGVEALAGG